jgi:peptidyl-prolyl cis-trans isomerase C
MQQKNLGLVLALAAGLALGGCGKKAGPEAGDVLIAKVNGEPLTLADVQVVQPGVTSGTVNPVVLGQLLDRKLMAQAAKKEKLDEVPAVRREWDNALEIARANSRGRKIAESIPAPTDPEFDAFIAAHPESFANRKFLVIEQIEFASPPKAISVAPSATIKSLDQVQATLDAARLPYQRTIVVVDTANAPPAVAQKLLSMPLNSLFQMSIGEINAGAEVLQVRDVPLGGPRAREITRNFLKNRALAAAINKANTDLRAGADIKFANGYAMP